MNDDTTGQRPDADSASPDRAGLDSAGLDSAGLDRAGRDISGDDVHAAVGSYIADALDAAERAAFATHLTTCPACRAEVADLAETAALLTHLTAASPPAGLLGQTLAAVRTVAQLPPLPAGDQPSAPLASAPPGPTQAAPDQPVPAPASDRTSRVDELAARRLRRSVQVSRWLGAAALIVAIVAGAGYVHTRQDLQHTQAQVQATRTLLAAPDLQTAQAPVTGGGTTFVLASVSQGQLLVTATGLPVLDVAHTYQMWLIGTTGKPRSAGTFDTSTGSARTDVHADLAGTTTLGITVEPAGGSPQPTTTPIFAQKLTS